jgi:hypothetical protein
MQESQHKTCTRGIAAIVKAKYLVYAFTKIKNPAASCGVLLLLLSYLGNGKATS